LNIKMKGAVNSEQLQIEGSGAMELLIKVI
jgi:hypothetical protein